MAGETRPVLYPVLSLKREARPAGVTGRSPTEKSIRKERLAQQRVHLAAQLHGLVDRQAHAHAGRILVAVRMFDDSFAPTHEPEALFRRSLGSELVAPIRDGYLAQVRLDCLDELAQIVSSSTRIDVRVAVSRIADIAALDPGDVLRQRSAQALWNRALPAKRGRLFTLWLAPFVEVASRDSVVRLLLQLQDDAFIEPVQNLVSITREPGSDADQLHLQDAPNANSLARAAREYREKQFSRVQLVVRDPAALEQIAASGGVFRIDPLRPIAAAEVPTAADPERPVPDEQWQPIVGVVDGGLFARSYEGMRAWEAPSLVADVAANRAHGNRVSSLVVHGHAWNTHLELPDLTCRIGVAQAIAKQGFGGASRTEFVSYLRSVIERHCGDTKVWNFSFNEPVDGTEPLEMSELGHEIHKLARTYNVLPVISIGNVDSANAHRLCPPADCEAALTVGGRSSDDAEPGPACESCLPGPGPEGLKKPEVSWFSTLRGLGGSAETGSSYAAAITSAVAAHAFHNLKSPTPDLVKALLINTAERDDHDTRLGWGSPCQRVALPWECPDGTVTLVWSAKLRAGHWYYWEDIPIPPELVRAGKLHGRAALTAVLRPVVSELGSANYFATRLQVALQYTTARGAIGNLVGSMRENIERERQARAEHAKWNPVRHHAKDFSRRGRAFRGQTLRVCARIFARDLYQFGLSSNAEVEPSEVAFALTLSAPAAQQQRTSIYNSVAAQLGTYVESAVNDVEIVVEQ